MKKKISLLLCLLMTVLCFTGCASKDDTVEYDEASIEQVTEFLIEYCASADEATIEQWKDMTEFEMEYQLTQAGLPLTPESFIGAMESWQAGIDECGEYSGTLRPGCNNGESFGYQYSAGICDSSFPETDDSDYCDRY